MRTQPSNGIVTENKVIFSFEDYSLIGIILWAVNRFDITSHGLFKILDHNSEIVPPEVFQEFQASVCSAIEKLERRIQGP